MPTHFRQWQVRIAAACLVALVPQLCTLRGARAAPDMAVAAPGAQRSGGQSAARQAARQQSGAQLDSLQQSIIKDRVPTSTGQTDPLDKLAARQALAKAKYAEAQRDAATLAELAQSLKSELAQGSANVVSLTAVNKAKEIEKLAKKLRKLNTAY